MHCSKAGGEARVGWARNRDPHDRQVGAAAPKIRRVRVRIGATQALVPRQADEVNGMIQAYDSAPSCARHVEFPLPGPEQHWDSAAVRRISALAADTTTARGFELSTLWLDACAGRLCFVDTFFSAERCYGIARRLPAGARRRPLSKHRQEILERILLGNRAKVVALELELSPSTVAGTLTHCLSYLGFPQSPDRLPLLLVMAARAARSTAHFHARTSPLVSADGELEVVSVPRPTLKLAEALSGAEREVTVRVVEGLDHEAIARMRGTSKRTIANQIAAAYRKLGISGRAELVNQVMEL